MIQVISLSRISIPEKLSSPRFLSIRKVCLLSWNTNSFLLKLGFLFTIQKTYLLILALSPFFSSRRGARIENVEVIAAPPDADSRENRIRRWDNPLANKAVDINIRTFDSHSGNVVGGIQGAGQTDAQGYFVQYVDKNRATGYRVSVEYHGLCATSEDFVIKVGERREDLILKLTGTLK